MRAEVARSSFEAAFSWLNRDVNAASPKTPDSSALKDGRPAERGNKSNSADHEAKTETNRVAGTGLQLLATEKSEFSAPVDPQIQSNNNGDSFFQRLLEGVPKALHIDAQSAIVPLMVELSGSAVLKLCLLHLHTALVGNQSGRSSQLLLDAWLMRFSGFDYSEANREKLLPYFCAMACCASHYHPTSSPAASKEYLQRLIKRELSESEIYDGAVMALTSNRFLRVGELDRVAIPVKAHVIYESVTLSQQLVELISKTINENVNAGVATQGEYGAIIDALRQHQKSTDRIFGIVADRPGNGQYCPCCHNIIHRDDQAKLRATRAFVCKNPYCSRPIFFGLDVTALARQGLAGRFRG